MMLLYRKDLFKQLRARGAEDLGRVRRDRRATLRAAGPQALPDHVLRRRPGLVRRARAAGRRRSGGTIDGKAWSVGIDDDATKRVADYWDGLVADKRILGEPMYTPQWNKHLNDGTLLAWPSAVWGPAVLEGIAPEDQGQVGDGAAAAVERRATTPSATGAARRPR